MSESTTTLSSVIVVDEFNQQSVQLGLFLEHRDAHTAAEELCALLRDTTIEIYTCLMLQGMNPWPVNVVTYHWDKLKGAEVVWKKADPSKVTFYPAPGEPDPYAGVTPALLED